MLLNFQKTFAMDVWLGLKRQTIRSAGQRKHVPKVGDIAHCYTGLRTKGTKLLGRWPVTRVDVIRFDMAPLIGILDPVLVGSHPMSRDELEELAKADGFANFLAMDRWFEANHPAGRFYGRVIGWEWSEELAAPDLGNVDWIGPKSIACRDCKHSSPLSKAALKCLSPTICKGNDQFEPGGV